MSDRLHIHSVNAERFGGLSKRRLELPDSPLVVVFGRNEAGKSTFSELISWLLVGPAASGAVVRRFASANEVLKGSLSGTLRGHEFAASAEFKVTPSGGGIGKASVREYQLDGPLTADQWLDRLGRLDQQAMTGIYRLWGQQLHDGGDADRELRRAGLGVLAESADPRELAKKLESLSKPGAKVGPDESSFKSLASELRSVGGELREAEANVDQYGEIEAEIQELEGRRTQLEDHRTELERRRNVLEKVVDLDQLRRDRESAAKSFRSCAPVTQEWADVVGHMSTLRTLLKSRDDVRAALGDDQVGFRQKLVAVGEEVSVTADEVLSGYAITATDTARVATAVSQIDHARSALNEATSKHNGAVVASESATDELDHALNGLATDSETLRRARLDEESRVQLGLFSKRFDAALESVEQAESLLDAAQVTVATARATYQRALEDRNSLGADSTPNGWRSGASRGVSRSADSRWMWALRAVLVAVALASVMAGQWILVVLAIVALVISRFARSISSPTGPADDADEAADSVAKAKSALDAAEIAEIATATELSNHRKRVDGAAAEVVDLSERYGIKFPGDPRLVAATLARWVAARDLLTEADGSQRKLEGMVVERERAVKAESDAKERLQALLTQLGLPPGTDPDASISRAGDYVALVESAGQVRQRDNELHNAESALHELLSPVEAEVEGWSREKLIEAAELAEERLKLRDGAKRKLDDAERVLEGSLGTDREVRQLFDERISIEERGREVDQIAAQLQSINHDINELSASIGLAEQQRETLRGAARVADLRLTRGSLAEAQHEIAAELAINRLAGVILRSVADVYERENQPDLVKRTGSLAGRVADDWESIKVKATGPDSSELRVQFVDGSDIAASSLSTGARALLYLSLRLAMADDDGEKRRIQVPILCDDPLVHLDDQRALSAMGLLTEASERRQVVVFTCHQRTAEAADAMGADIVRI